MGNGISKIIKELFEQSKKSAKIDDELSDIVEKFVCTSEEVKEKNLTDLIINLAETRAANYKPCDQSPEEKTGTG